jgi:hypothetical protein
MRLFLYSLLMSAEVGMGVHYLLYPNPARPEAAPIAFAAAAMMLGFIITIAAGEKRK